MSRSDDPAHRGAPTSGPRSLTSDMMIDRLRATTRGTTASTTPARELPAAMMIAAIVEVITPQQSSHSEHKIMGTLIAEHTRHVTMITIARTSIPWALEETCIDVETTTPNLTIHAMIVRPHHARTMTSPTIGITIADGHLVHPIVTTMSETSMTDVMTQIVVVRTIALACRRA